MGINLNPDKICNFDCVYCQVDRSIAPEFRQVEPERVLSELEETIALVQSGRLYDDPRFADVPGSLRRLSDIAFSGDGEPTTYPGFLEIVRDVAALKRRLNLGDVKLVLLTNATMLHRKEVKEALEVLDANQTPVPRTITGRSTGPRFRWLAFSQTSWARPVKERLSFRACS